MRIMLPATTHRVYLTAILTAIPFIVNAGGSLQAQQSVDGSITVTGEVRNYAIYLPSGYDPGRPSALILALHPLNTLRWNAGSWRDTLTVFAEASGAILLCPDGGSDGNIINQQRDTLLATALLDSAAVWYNVDSLRIYAMGFSVGGLATYVYGLANPWRFAGYLPVGAAMNGTNEIADLLPNVAGKPVCVVHGSGDSPESRYYPAVDGLTSNGGILQAVLMPGVGHTIDFPDRNAILTDAFRWIDSINMERQASDVEEVDERGNTDRLRFYPNPIARGTEGTFEWDDGLSPRRLRVIDLSGRPVHDVRVTLIDRSSAKILPRSLSPGVYFLEACDQSDRRMIRFVIR